MRAQCQDGVTIANSLLYWWPSVCDCNLTLYGITSLGPAEGLVFDAAVREEDRLERAPASGTAGEAPPAVREDPPADWNAFRADSAASGISTATVPGKVRKLWDFALPAGAVPTAPSAAGGLIFLGASDGTVRAIDGATGALAWKAFTGGAIRFPPSIWEGRAYAGSGDGRVVALDARTGRIIWQNNASGHLDQGAIAGVSVQGHLIIHGGKLWMAGGNAVSPAAFDLASGRCLNDPGLVNQRINNNVPASVSPRGADLYLVAGEVMVGGQPFYAHPQYKVYDASVIERTWVAADQERDVAWVNGSRVICLRHADGDLARKYLEHWGKMRIPGLEPIWSAETRDGAAMARVRNAVVAAGAAEVAALDLGDGRRLWAEALSAPPVPWGLAVDRTGRVVVSLEDGRVLCFGSAQE